MVRALSHREHICIHLPSEIKGINPSESGETRPPPVIKGINPSESGETRPPPVIKGINPSESGETRPPLVTKGINPSASVETCPPLEIKGINPFDPPPYTPQSTSPSHQLPMASSLALLRLSPLPNYLSQNRFPSLPTIQFLPNTLSHRKSAVTGYLFPVARRESLIH